MLTPDHKEAIKAIEDIRVRVGTELFDLYAEYLVDRLENHNAKTLPEANGATDRAAETIVELVGCYIEKEPILMQADPQVVGGLASFAFYIGYWMAVEDAKLNNLEG